MPAQERALKLHLLALSAVEAKGRLVTIGLTTLREYRSGNDPIIHYMPSSGHLDVWYRRKVLVINRQYGQLVVTQYTPGEWEQELEIEATRGRDPR
jgi:hypothetical protein